MFKIDIDALTQKYRRMLITELGGKAALSPLRLKTVDFTAQLMARADEFISREPKTPSDFYIVTTMQRQIDRQYKILGLVTADKPLPGGKPKAEPAPKTIAEYAKANGKGAIQ